MRSRKIMENFPIRKSKAQKEKFASWLTKELRGMGYAPQVEECRNLVTCRNIIAGDPDKAELLLTAHYDTCAVLPFPNFITPRNPVVFLLYQLLIAALMLCILFGAEFLLLALWRDVPMWLCMVVVYSLLIFLLWWMMAGKANKSNVNDNTSGVMTLFEIAAALPPEYRDKVCFVWFDNEEKGLLGSSAFARKHKAAKKDALVLNFDCVSDGDHLHLFPSKALRRDRHAMDALGRAFQSQGEKVFHLVDGFGIYPSDQRCFKRGVGICSLKKSRLVGYYMDKIHTGRDTVMEEEDLLLFRDGVLSYIRDNISQGQAAQ